MRVVAQVLSSLPEGLRTPLLEEFNLMVSHFVQGKWAPAELSGGHFCEIVYTVIDGYGSGSYPSTPNKPSNLVQSCRKLETRTAVPRSFQILIPRLLPALYEIRNNRGVGHVGGDVDPNFMDAAAVVSMSSWILAELIRVFHGTTTEEAQTLVNQLAEVRIPLIWRSGAKKRVLDPDLRLDEQVLVLAASVPSTVPILQLLDWMDYKNPSYLRNTVLRRLHSRRLIDFDDNIGTIQILPPGAKRASELAIAWANI